MTDSDTPYANLDQAMDYLALKLEEPLTAEELSYALSCAPLGELNPALEAAVATARFSAGMTGPKQYVAALRRHIDNASQAETEN